MNTTTELKNLEDELRAARNEGAYVVSATILFCVVICIIAIYLMSFFIKNEIHEAIQEENITAQIKEGIDSAFNQFEKYEPNN